MSEGDGVDVDGLTAADPTPIRPELVRSVADKRADPLHIVDFPPTVGRPGKRRREPKTGPRFLSPRQRRAPIGRRGARRPTTFIFTSSHGSPMFDHPTVTFGVGRVIDDPPARLANATPE